MKSDKIKKRVIRRMIWKVVLVVALVAFGVLAFWLRSASDGNIVGRHLQLGAIRRTWGTEGTQKPPWLYSLIQSHPKVYYQVVSIFPSLHWRLGGMKDLKLGDNELSWSIMNQGALYLYFNTGGTGAWEFAPAGKHSLTNITSIDLRMEFAGENTPNRSSLFPQEADQPVIVVGKGVILLARRTEAPHLIYVLSIRDLALGEYENPIGMQPVPDIVVDYLQVDTSKIKASQ